MYIYYGIKVCTMLMYTMELKRVLCWCTMLSSQSHTSWDENHQESILLKALTSHKIMWRAYTLGRLVLLGLPGNPRQLLAVAAPWLVWWFFLCSRVREGHPSNVCAKEVQRWERRKEAMCDTLGGDSSLAFICNGSLVMHLVLRINRQYSSPLILSPSTNMKHFFWKS